MHITVKPSLTMYHINVSPQNTFVMPTQEVLQGGTNINLPWTRHFPRRRLGCPPSWTWAQWTPWLPSVPPADPYLSPTAPSDATPSAVLHHLQMTFKQVQLEKDIFFNTNLISLKLPADGRAKIIYVSAFSHFLRSQLFPSDAWCCAAKMLKYWEWWLIHSSSLWWCLKFSFSNWETHLITHK